MHIDRRLLGWGVFFVLIGAVPLAVRAGLVDESQVESWPLLWPILLIGWGAGLLLRRTPVEWIGGGVAAVILGLMAGGALATGFNGVSMFGGCGGEQGSPFTTQGGTLASGGQLNVEFSCGLVTLRSAEGSDWSISGTDRGGRGPNIDVSGSSVSIETPHGAFFQDVGGQNNWTVGVPTAVPLGLGMTLNAGRGTADLAGANITSASLTVNAGSFELGLAGATDLGDVNATVNAGDASISLPSGDRSGNLSLNAGNLEVCVPADAALRVRWSGALGSNDLDESGLTEVDDNIWVTDGFTEGAPHLELRVSANAGSFDLTIGGVCNA